MPAADTWWCRAVRDVVVVHGPDATAYLQSQLSQDIAGLSPGTSQWSFLLAPDGKVEALVRVLRTDADRYALDVDAGSGDAVAARLRRFLIRTKAEVESESWSCLAVRGPAAPAVVAGGAAGGAAYVVVSWWASPEAADLLGPAPAVPRQVREASLDELEAARVAAGWPAMGSEITPGETIPAETGIVDVAVSFTKGCYPGQELVERMHARGAQAPRYVRRLQATGPLELGADILHGGRVAGTVTSVAGTVGLGVVARSVQPGDPVDIAGQPVTVLAVGPG